MLYMVRRYTDCQESVGCGVNDYYSLVGVFDNEEKANAVKVEAERKAKDLKYYQKFVVIPVELNKQYAEEDEPYLGGGCYIE